ncbi:hypothetical protein CKO28_19645 [Rhodovibrio sodomensis]|uniref:Uncharacterized protein n=1 Tax=Rhodovibrio sodomensis TaxID=1088 RepID=A0ABS1DJG0_9PROT|nr:hypothetical protein [Rhodovibrio sodomensis]
MARADDSRGSGSCDRSLVRDSRAGIQRFLATATPLEPIPLLHWEEGLGEEGPRGIGFAGNRAAGANAAGNLLSLALSSHWRRGD